MASPAGDSGERGKELTDRPRRRADTCVHRRVLSASIEGDKTLTTSDNLCRRKADTKRPVEG